MNNIKKIPEFSYTKSEAKIVSGVALIMMLIHHFWGYPMWLNPENTCINIIKLGDRSLEEVLAGGCKLCISMFAFNSGYVLFKRKEDFTFVKNLRRILKFLISYWIIYFSFIGYGLLTNENIPDLHTIVLQLFGIRCGLPGYISVPFAWYVNYYISFTLITPLVVYLTNGTKPLKDILFVVLWILLLVLSVLIPHFINNEVITKTVLNLFSIGLTSVCAYMIAKHNILGFLNARWTKTVWINIIAFFAIIIIENELTKLLYVTIGHSLAYFQDCIYAPLLILCLLNIIRTENETSWVIKTLKFTGVYSMNIWFVHGIFYTGTRSIQWLLYLPQYSIFVLIWGFILTVPICVLLSKIQSRVLKIMRI